ncbi:MAG TPA: ice-binding family protein [Cytophagales bacterium]|nr:ice-binding family protein [Cytophagales bacterium]
MHKKYLQVALLSLLTSGMLVSCGDVKKTDETQDPNHNMPLPAQEIVPLTITLGEASKFTVLAGSEVSSTEASVITGTVGISPGNSLKGFPPGVINGEKHIGDAKDAQKDLAAAFKAGNEMTSPTIVTLKDNLGNLALVPGLYKAETSLELSSGDLTFDAKGDSNSIFVVQIPASLTVSPGSKMILQNGALPKNIYWLIGSSVNLDSTSVAKGIFIAEESIILKRGAALQGKALSKTGSVQLQGSSIVAP